MAAAFRFTTGRWYNRYDPETQRTAKAPAYREGFTYASFAYGSDTPEDFTPAGGVPVQQSLICARATNLLVIDVDNPEQLPASATGQIVSWSDALSTRGSHFHVGVDMRGAPAEAWPVQGKTAWGDIKSSGFVAAPGSVHFTGEPYAPGAGTLIPWTPELTAALEADKLALALAKRNEWNTARGLASGTRLEDGAYLYSSGYVRGSWEQIPDGGLKYDDELKDLLWDMHVEFGRDETECLAQWERLAGALSSPWTTRDFTRHFRRVPARRAEREAEENWLEDTFGLTAAEEPVAARAREQQEAYEQQVAGQGGFGPPTPVQGDGIYEYDADGISWFHVYLGAVPDSQLFDAGRPTDAGNAEAVLYRARNALRHDEEADTWLKRVAGRWVQDDDAAKEAVTALGWKLPAGSADPLKDPHWEHLDPETDGVTIAALKRHAKNSERFSTSSVVNGIAAMMKNIARARSEQWMTVRDSTVDADPEILWAGGVPWDLKASLAGPVRSARTERSTPHLHSAGCVPDASVATPLWDALMQAVWVDSYGKFDEWLAAWALLVLSAGVTGYPKKAVPLLKGGTDRGKSTVIDAIANVLGTYFRPLNSKILDAAASTHDTVLMELKGTRLTFLDEGIQRGKVATARLKRLVGGSSITANRMRQDPVTFRPTHTLAITLNPEESFSFDDPAVDSRIRLLPCDGDPEAVIAVAKLFNYYQSAAWLKERSGVLAKLMSAAAVLLNDPHALDKDHAPKAVSMAEQEIKNEEDDVLRWYMEATADCPSGYGSRDLFIAFREWTRETKGDRAFIPSEKKWALRMDQLVPEDAENKLYTSNKSRLRRRRPVQPGTTGGLGGITPADFMRGPGFSGGEPNRPQPTVADHLKNTSSRVDQAPRPTDPPADPPEPSTRGFSLFTVGPVDQVGSIQSIPRKENPPYPPSTNGTGATHRHTGPTGTTPREAVSEPDPEDASAGAEPVVSNMVIRPENCEKAENGQKSNSPPKPKIPRVKMTPEERAVRDAVKKAEQALARAEAKTAKVAELGGRLVSLPALVLRDQSVIECTPDQAAAFLNPVLGELSVDVEHSGYPRKHKDYKLRLVQLGTEHFGVVFDPADREQAGVIRYALKHAGTLHAHSALADLIPLEAAGLCDETVWDRMIDTVNLAKLTDPGLCDSDEAGLKQLARDLLGEAHALSWKAERLKAEIFAAGGWIGDLEVTTPVERSGWANIPVCEAFVRYAAADVMDCSAVARALQEAS